MTDFGVEERMSWAAHRNTTLKEDKVYCLLGIFGVYLPLIYGEGVDYATQRLKEEIRRRQNGDEERESIRILRTSEYEQFRDRNSNRLEGTC